MWYDSAYTGLKLNNLILYLHNVDTLNIWMRNLVLKLNIGQNDSYEKKAYYKLKKKCCGSNFSRFNKDHTEDKQIPK